MRISFHIAIQIGNFTAELPVMQRNHKQNCRNCPTGAQSPSDARPQPLNQPVFTVFRDPSGCREAETPVCLLNSKVLIPEK